MNNKQVTIVTHCRVNAMSTSNLILCNNRSMIMHKSMLMIALNIISFNGYTKNALLQPYNLEISLYVH